MTQKSKRLYFTDPIKALYMMKEFGVKLECRNSDEEMSEYDLNEDERFYPFEHCDANDLDYPIMITDINSYCQNFRNIYVKKESESIFEPKKKDEGRKVMLGGYFYVQYKDNEWSAYGTFGLSTKNVKIIMRDGKHFFMPEVENE